MAVKTQTAPMISQVDVEGHLALTEQFLSNTGLQKGDQVLMLPVGDGLFYMYKLDRADALSTETLRQLMRTAFAQSGYTTREQVLDLIKSVKEERAQE